MLLCSYDAVMKCCWRIKNEKIEIVKVIELQQHYYTNTQQLSMSSFLL